jgi:hypothetical protein
MPFRFLIVAFLIILGAVLSIPAAAAVWEEREIKDEDQFVQNVLDVANDEEVQALLAQRLTDRILERTNLRQRISEGLTEVQERAGSDRGAAIPLLAAPLTRLAGDTINRLCLQFMQSDAFDDILETAARTAHRAVLAVVNNDRQLIEQNGSQIALNLRPVVVQIIEALAGDRAEQALSRIDIPEDAGVIVISSEADYPWLWRLARWIDNLILITPALMVLAFLAAILVAKSKRRALISAGAALAVVAGLTLLALGGPVKGLATSWPPREEGEQAMKQVYEILLDDFRRQQAFVVIFGLGVVVVGSAAGDRRVVQAVRAAVSRKEDADTGGLIRERAGALRLAGMFVAGVILIVWPEPTLRTLIAVGLLLGLYLAAIWLIASDSDWATRARDRLSESLVPSRDAPIQRRVGLVGWVAVHAWLLRLAGVLVAAAVLLFFWDLSLGGLILIAAALLIYLAVIEWTLTEARRPLDSLED